MLTGRGADIFEITDEPLGDASGHPVDDAEESTCHGRERSADANSTVRSRRLAAAAALAAAGLAVALAATRDAGVAGQQRPETPASAHGSAASVGARDKERLANPPRRRRAHRRRPAQRSAVTRAVEPPLLASRQDASPAALAAPPVPVAPSLPPPPALAVAKSAEAAPHEEFGFER